MAKYALSIARLGKIVVWDDADGFPLKIQRIDGGTPNAFASNGLFSDADGNFSAGSASGAPTDAQYITAASNSTLSAERVATNTATVTWDFGTAGQAKANVPNLSGTNTGDQTNISGNAATVTTNANLTGPITSVGNATTVADAELAALAGLTSAANKVPRFTGSGTAELIDLVYGTWTPTASVNTNVSPAPSNLTGIYRRVGNVVFFAISARVDCVAGAPTLSVIEFTPPVASNFSSSLQCIGGGTYAGATHHDAVSLFSSAANDTIYAQWYATSTAAVDLKLFGSYSII